MVNKLVLEDLESIANAIAPESKALEGKTILISGGSGFIGNYLVATIYYLNNNVFSKKCRVISIDNYITGSRKNIIGEPDENFEFIEHDIRKPLEVEFDIDYVIHAAGIASPIYYRKYPIETIEVHTLGTKNLLELARRKSVKSFLFFSSSEVYGDPDPKFVPTPETYRGVVSPVGPRAAYDESKRLGETLCITFFELYGIPIKIVRPFNVYGPGMKPDDRRVVPTFLVNALKGKPLPVYNEGMQTRTFCYITDAITAFFKILLSGRNGEVYNAGNDANEINIMDLASIISEFFGGMDIQKIDHPDKAYSKEEPQRRCPDLTKIRSELGYKPSVSLNDGLRRVLEWYKIEYGF